MEDPIVLHIFGVHSSVDKQSLMKTVMNVLGCGDANIRTVFHIPEKESVKIVLADLKNTDLKHLKSLGHISIAKQIFPVVINEEIFSETELTFSHDLYEILKNKQFQSSNSSDSTQLFEKLKATRTTEDSPWILKGTVSDLYKFQEKVNAILGFETVNSDRKSVACSTDVEQNDVTDVFSPTIDVIPKANGNGRSSVANVLFDQSNVVSSSITVQPSHLPSDELYLQIGNSLKISIFVGDITKEAVSAIVNPIYESKDLETNNHLKRIGVQSVQQNAKKVYVTGHVDYYVANGLACGRVIDVNLPSYDCSDGDPETVLIPILQNCYVNCVGLAKWLEISSIAFQPLAGELFDGSVFLSAISATKAVLNLINQDNLGTIKDIRFITPSQDFARIFVDRFLRLIDELKQFVDVKLSYSKDKSVSSTMQTKADLDGPSTSSNANGRHSFSSTPPGFEEPVPKKILSIDADRFVDESDKMDVDSQATNDKAKNHVTGKTGESKAVAVAAASAHIEECSICFNELYSKGQIKMLSKCQHKFHIECIDEWMRIKNSCPLCQTFYGVPGGNQPEGDMRMKTINTGSVPGFNDSKGYIEIQYSFPHGIQGPNHPHPGKPYSGTSRIAYLPNNPRGQLIAKLLRKAFDCKLIFTVGTSVTTGVQNTVVWNNIHHKTSLNRGPFGYPDATYLDRVEEELKAAGIDKSML